MAESDSINKSKTPNTRKSIVRDLQNLGLHPGMTIITHSSLSALGWVCGGAITVVQALMDVITLDGTLVMPTHSADYSEPSFWKNPPVPSSWLETIRESMPGFDPKVTPTRGMGVIAETFRSFSDVQRSYHPSSSFSAWGKHAGAITRSHGLEDSLGENSPLARIYDLNGSILLLGVGHEVNTSMHLAECRIPEVTRLTQGGPVFEGGKRLWKCYQDVDYNIEPFRQIGRDFEQSHSVHKGYIGAANASLMKQRALVDFTVNQLNHLVMKKRLVKL